MGYVVSEWQRLEDGGSQFKLVVPYTTHFITIVIREKDLDDIKFELTKRGDDYSPNRRNEILGLPLVPPPVYVEPEPIAIYPAGTRISDVHHFDRSMKVAFHCCDHPQNVFLSKDPYVSNWFKLEGAWCPDGCVAQVGDHIVHTDYKPTRNG
jgi:hypothetical protein